VEDFPIARLFRQSPLNSIWEGSGNVVALDIILRARRSLPVLMDLVRSAKGRQLKPFDEYVDRLDGMGEDDLPTHFTYAYTVYCTIIFASQSIASHPYLQ
jgi:putative acyl-CoA dehydrogenase